MGCEIGGVKLRMVMSFKQPATAVVDGTVGRVIQIFFIKLEELGVSAGIPREKNNTFFEDSKKFSRWS
jgi:hypothetical protein